MGVHRPNSSLPIDCSSAPVWNALIASPHSSAAMCAGSVRPPLTPLSGPCSRRHPRGSSIRTYRDTRFRKAPSAAAVDGVELMDWEPETGRDVPSQHRRFHLARSAAADRAWSSARAHAGRTEAERARAQPARDARQDVSADCIHEILSPTQSRSAMRTSSAAHRRRHALALRQVPHPRSSQNRQGLTFADASDAGTRCKRSAPGMNQGRAESRSKSASTAAISFCLRGSCAAGVAWRRFRR